MAPSSYSTYIENIDLGESWKHVPFVFHIVQISHKNDGWQFMTNEWTCSKWHNKIAKADNGRRLIGMNTNNDIYWRSRLHTKYADRKCIKEILTILKMKILFRRYTAVMWCTPLKWRHSMFSKQISVLPTCDKCMKHWHVSKSCVQWITKNIPEQHLRSFVVAHSRTYP